jgi:hypothetical protein
MPRQFQVESGFIVRVGHVWHDSNAMLFVEEDERAEIYIANKGEPGCCLGSYGHAELEQSAAPFGLRAVAGGKETALPAAAVAVQAQFWVPSWNATWTRLPVDRVDGLPPVQPDIIAPRRRSYAKAHVRPSGLMASVF